MEGFLDEVLLLFQYPPPSPSSPGFATALLKGMLGGRRLLPIFVVEGTLGVGRCWMSLAPCSFLILVMFVSETRLC